MVGNIEGCWMKQIKYKLKGEKVSAPVRAVFASGHMLTLGMAHPARPGPARPHPQIGSRTRRARYPGVAASVGPSHAEPRLEELGRSDQAEAGDRAAAAGYGDPTEGEQRGVSWVTGIALDGELIAGTPRGSSNLATKMAAQGSVRRARRLSWRKWSGASGRVNKVM